jgi:hypothetical protein
MILMFLLKLNFFVKPFLYSLDIIDIQYKNFAEDYIQLTMINDLKITWSEYLQMPVKMREYFIERVREIAEKRAKALSSK